MRIIIARDLFFQKSVKKKKKKKRKFSLSDIEKNESITRQD